MTIISEVVSDHSLEPLNPSPRGFDSRSTRVLTFIQGSLPNDRKAIDFTRMFDRAHFDIIIWVIKTENRISEKYIYKA